MEIKNFGPNNEVSVAVTVMRNGVERGRNSDELLDGNTIPRLCRAVGEGACAQACLLLDFERSEVGAMCAENNIASALEKFGVSPENFVLAAATQDNVFFGDFLEETKVFESPEGYSQLPEANAFFFRPGIDKAPNGQLIDAVGMRMADCGSVNYRMLDRNGNLVLGQAHFSRTNMNGPSAFKHELQGEQVSWGEYVLTSAIEHYGASPESVEIYLAAAVEGKDFVHTYDSEQKMEEHYPGWEELGFMHRTTSNGATLIDYREMIDWQLNQAAITHGLESHQIKTTEAINTGDISLGHASHHWASKGSIEHGRDLYLVGRSKEKELIVSDFDRAVTGEVIKRVVELPLEAGMPKLDSDPFVTLYELHMGHAAPPRELWDTEENRTVAMQDGHHPMTYWLMGSEVPSEPKLQKLYDEWMKDISER